MAPAWLLAAVCALGACGGPEFRERATAVDAPDDAAADAPSSAAEAAPASSAARPGDGGACVAVFECMSAGAKGAVCSPPWSPCSSASDYPCNADVEACCTVCQ